MFCKQCGTVMNDGARFCPKCGAVQNTAGGTPLNSGEGGYRSIFRRDWR
ncbi:MAG: zinc ribbon domain-containing protein [Ruminococcus sp.]|nr:zinc ribbon domain-containing protein [Ruminococcus sp.]